MKITQDVRDYAATLNDNEQGMAQMSKKFRHGRGGVCRGGGGEGEQQGVVMPFVGGFAEGVTHRFARRKKATRHCDMAESSSLSLDELNDRIAILRDNLRQLAEQAAAMSGAADESRNADRIAQQEAELDRLTEQRDALGKK